MMPTHKTTKPKATQHVCIFIALSVVHWIPREEIKGKEQGNVQNLYARKTHAFAYSDGFFLFL